LFSKVVGIDIGVMGYNNHYSILQGFMENHHAT